MTLLYAPSPVILPFLNFVEMVRLREVSKDARSHFKVGEVMRIMRGRLFTSVGSPAAKLMMCGGFVLGGHAAFQWIQNIPLDSMPYLYYSMNYPPPVLAHADADRVAFIIRYLEQTMGVSFLERTSDRGRRSIHEEMSFGIITPLEIIAQLEVTVHFSRAGGRAAMIIEISGRA
jgi:hypothetical protein